MSTIAETQSDQERRALYTGLAIVAVVLVVIGLLTFKATATTIEAEEKAAQLTSELEAAGARAPSSEVLVRVLGDDGGAVCQDPNSALARGTLLSQLSTGASGPGARPIIADNRVVRGQLAILKVYCPDELAEFQQFVDDLKLDDAVAGS
jgi:Tfp pilus assembly protein FimT